ncbi:hypothetical protein [Donghicola sp.]|jgi:flagellar basal body-associated protein FliL|uniref:hypothetical protein n=1 Tax=Donghicola sp. TaxID=1929294 RepID=UPI0025FE1DDB|nr:hypothetical protein [Donghicola sp.]MCT4579034.1 hypothetical protein [Donghicola sp.]
MSAEPISSKASILLTILPAIVVVGAFGGGLYFSLTAKPDLPEPEIVEEEVLEEETEDLPDRTYIDIINPIKATLPQLGGTVLINIGLAIREDVGKKVYDMLKNNPGPLMAPMTDAVQDLVDQMPPDSDWQDLRAELPAVIRDKMNVELTSEDRPNPVYEVLILNFTIGG